ncbi:MAG: hypothetical protein AAFY11_14685 [Cyanobacteria bacterium J06641_5]
MSSPPIKALRSLPTVLCALTGVGIGAEAVTAAPAKTLTAFNPEAFDLNVAPPPAAPTSTTISTSAATLLETPIGLQTIPERGLEVAQATGRRRRRAVRRTPPAENYIGAGFNIGLSDGENSASALGTENAVIFSRIKLSRRISLRPAVVVGNDATFTVPATFDIPLRGKSPTFLAKPRPEAFVGGGLLFGLDSEDSNEVGGAILGGIDYPFARQLTANVTVTSGFSDGDVSVGALFGVAYRFPRR